MKLLRSLFQYKALLLFFVFALSKSFGQTVLISPTGDGGFETGATFAANGWTSVNSTNNIWVLDNLAPAFAGSRGAHVSTNGTAYNYDIATNRTSHFYRDVVIPAGATSITLNFQWKGNGENNYDRLLVYTAPTTVTPVLNSPASTSMVMSGATLVWNQTAFQAGYATANIVLPAGLAGTTVRLIFTWQGDGSVGTMPPAAVDNISLVYTPATPMVYSSSTTTQINTSSVPAGSTNQEIIGMQVVTTGNTSPLSVTQFTVNANGTTAISDINAATAKIYYTGTSSTFATTTLFGATTPTVANFTINGTQTLSTGTNYFWLVYDVQGGATIGNLIDGECTSINIGGAQTPTITAPTGTRPIIAEIPKPGGVLGATVWFDASSGVQSGGAAATNGAQVDQWNNKITTIPAINNVVQPTAAKRPLFNSTPFNYNPTIMYDGTDDRMEKMNILGSSFLNASQNTIAIVHQYRSGIVIFKFFENGIGGSVNYEVNTLNYRFDFTPNTYSSSAVTFINEIDIFSTRTSHLGNNIINNNGVPFSTAVSAPAFPTGQVKDFYFGENPQAAWPLNAGMDLAEFVIFPKNLSDNEQRQLESYLAIKYGVTLSNSGGGTNGDYLTSNTVIAWDASVSPSYHNNVIGIARDDSQGFYQKQSKTQNNVTFLYLSTLETTNNANAGIFNNDDAYVVVGSTTGAMCANAAALAEMPASCGLYFRIEREWKATRTNMAEPFNMDFNLAACGAPGSVDPDDLRLLVDDDGNFGNGGTSCYDNVSNPGLFTYSNPTIKVTGITAAMFPNNSTRYLTIGSVNAATPLPVELLTFDATLNQKRTVDLTWTTATEYNSDYFIAERSIDFQNWENVCLVQAAGNSSNELNYACEDTNPILGLNYYRLKQVDKDGTFEYSDIRVVNLESTQDVSIYPNPTNSIFSIQVKDIDSKEIKFFNALGQEVEVSLVASSKDLYQFDTVDLSDGIYYIQVTTGLDSTTYKLIVLKNK